MAGTAENLDTILRIGQLVKFSLRVHSADDEVREKQANGVRTYRSHIQDLLPEHVVVGWPTERGDHIPISVGQGASLRIPFDRGVLQLVSSVSGGVAEPIPLVHVNRRGEWSRHQLRLHVRLHEVIVPREILLVAIGGDQIDDGVKGSGWIVDALKKGQLQGNPIRARIVNLSAGGMMLASSSVLEMGCIVRVKFPLEKGQQEILALAKVVWVEEDAGEGGCEAGCQFVGLGPREQDVIAKHIFSKQVELRRRGLL